MKAKSNEIEVRVPNEVFQKIMHWINKSSNEVSGFGNLTYDAKNKRFTVVDAFLIEQENGAATTEIAAGAMGKMMYKHKDFGPGSLKWWWHSHVNMAVFWSGTDTDTIKQYGANGYIVATVFNKRQETRSAVCYKATTESVVTPSNKLFGGALKEKIESTIMIDDVRTLIEYPAIWDEEYDACVKERTYVSNVTAYKQGSRDNSAPYAGRGSGDADHYTSWQEEYELQKAEKAKMISMGIDVSEVYEKGRTFLHGVGWIWEKDLDAATAPSEAAQQPTLFNSERKIGENLYVNGLLGNRSIVAEAKALSMPRKEYETKLALGTEKELDDMTERLIKLEDAGFFDDKTTK